MGAAAEIIDWSQGRPFWQQDALRRLALKRELSTNDLDELVLIVKEQQGLVDPSATAPKPTPISASDLPYQAVTEAVSLRSLTDVKYVNALASDQTLTFEPQGLTVIYGDNATGKSGYIRILKRLCRARACEAILGNVFDASNAGQPPCARIEYALGGECLSLSWSEGSVCPDDLGAISVFDSLSAAVYVKKEGEIEVAFVPFGLDLLPKLAAVCDEVAKRLDQQLVADISRLEHMPPNLLATPSSRWLTGISHKTSQAEIDEHTTFSEHHAEENARLGIVLAEQKPGHRAAELETKANRYQQLRESLLAVGAVFTDEHLEDLVKARQALQHAEKLAALAAAQRFGNVPIPVVGSIAWEHLWNAAEEFRKEIHAAHAAEPVATEEICPLCQQVLDQDAQTRFRVFREHFDAKARSDEADKRQAFQDALTKIIDAPVDEDSYKGVLDDLRVDNVQVANDLVKYLRTCRNAQAFAESVGDVSLKKPEVGALDLQPLDDLIASFKIRVSELRAAAEPQGNAELQTRATDLEARRWLANCRDPIAKEVERLRRRHALEEAKRGADTRGITSTATKLTKRYVTDRLKESFRAELEAVTTLAPRVKLVGRPGRKGDSHYRIEIDRTADEEIGMTAVLSEGESRAISLAAFLSELPTDRRSAVIFDDPVSSLDIHNREALAARMVKLARDRQVIVFTHDVFFLVTLLDKARKEVPHSSYMLERMPDVAGVVVHDTPWEGRRLPEILGTLRKLSAEARKAARPDNFRDYNVRLTEIREGIRKAVEKAVEDVLLSGIVKRYQKQVHVQEVRKLAAIDKTDTDFLDTLMSRYSAPLHTQTPESRVPAPDIDQLERDIENLDRWRSEFNNKAKKASAAPRHGNG